MHYVDFAFTATASLIVLYRGVIQVHNGPLVVGSDENIGCLQMVVGFVSLGFSFYHLFH
jgi:hypothetical protein